MKCVLFQASSLLFFFLKRMDAIPSDNDEISPEESLLGRKGKRSRRNLREPKTVEKKSYTGYLILLCILNFFNYTGYSALSPNLTAISKEFNMTAEERDRKLGRDLNTVYLLISAPVTFLITYAADKMNRKYLFAWNTLICQISGILTGCVTSYTQLFLCRGLGGITMGAAMPIMFSLLGDLFSNNSRSKASALASVVMGLGMLFGQVISGLMGQHYGWKSPFLLCSILGTIFSLCAFSIIYSFTNFL